MSSRKVDTNLMQIIVKHAETVEKTPNYMQYLLALLQLDFVFRQDSVKAGCFKDLRHDMEKRFGLATLDSLTLDDDLE